MRIVTRMARLGKQGKITPVFQARGKTKRQQTNNQKDKKTIIKKTKRQRHKKLGVRQKETRKTF